MVYYYGFLVASLLNTLGYLRVIAVNYLNTLRKIYDCNGLSAVGLSADFKKMIKTGVKPIFLGLIVWFTVAIVSIFVQLVTHQI